MNKHILDKPILRDLFWFIVLPYKFKQYVKEDLVEYLQHDSWRCGYHQECHCGLDDLTDKLKLERIPLPNK